MRIREIVLTNVRSFRGERRISFVDPLLDVVRAVTVLAGSNGSGKTTILDAIYGLLEFIESDFKPNDFVSEVLETGFVCLTLEVGKDEWGDIEQINVGEEGAPEGHIIFLCIAVGRRKLAPDNYEQLWPFLFAYLKNDSERPKLITKGPYCLDVQHTGRIKDHFGGLLYFPYDCQLGRYAGGPIEPPSSQKSWLSRFSSTNKWKGSLEQFWVWQNYLDLEQRYLSENGSTGAPPARMAPYVERVENILGEGRKISILEGRAWVSMAWQNGGQPAKVRLDQLPSGEKQSLLLFGEMARWRSQLLGGVLIIDEIENSLHPTLQRLVMWNLKTLAREWDIQVIVATHSLEIIQTVRGSAFVNLDYPEDQFSLSQEENLAAEVS
jgi:energy-coupling factor transporter ATP-binding protein EcfA2